jgi:Zn-dependent metalloprotease
VDSIPNNSVVDIENMNSEGELEISFNNDKTQVVSVEGKYSDIVVENADDALDTIYGIRTVLGIANPYEELKILVINSDEYGAEYTFSQTYNGYDVLGKRITISANSDGITDSLGSGIYPSAKLAQVDTVAKISRAEAETIAANKYGGECRAVDGETKLVYYTLGEYEINPSFAYSVFVNGTDIAGNYVTSTVFVDSQTGTVISVQEEINSASADTGKGKNELGEKVTFPIAFTWTDWYFFYMQDLDREIQMYNQEFFINYRIGSEFNWWIDETAISAYTNVIKIYDWYKKTLKK